MRTYSKPVVEIENFRLDAQFASGGCAGGTVDPSELATVEAWFDEYFKNGGDRTGYVAQFIGLLGGLTKAEYEANKDKYLNDLYWYDISQMHGDNPTSGSCYFTYFDASGKSFS